MKSRVLFFNRNIIPRLAVAIGGIFLALRYTKECYRGMEAGIGFCLNVLIPSLFFFMVVAAYIVASGVASAICRPLRKLSKVVFGLSSEGLAAILLSMIGGYPVGAACADILYRERRLSGSEAAKTAYIAVAAGPGFLVNYIGAALLNNKQAGFLLLAAQVTGVILTGVIVGHTVESEPLPHTSAPHHKNGNLLVSAVKNASRAAFGMCAMVVVFSALIEVTDAIIPDRSVCDMVSAVIEITNGCNRICTDVPLYMTAFFVGFGGLSVHFQIFSTLGDIPLKKGLFFLFRIIEGIITMAAAYIYLIAAPMTVTVFSSRSAPSTVAQSATAAGSAALVISALFFIGSISKKPASAPAEHKRR